MIELRFLFSRSKGTALISQNLKIRTPVAFDDVQIFSRCFEYLIKNFGVIAKKSVTGYAWKAEIEIPGLLGAIRREQIEGELWPTKSQYDGVTIIVRGDDEAVVIVVNAFQALAAAPQKAPRA